MDGMSLTWILVLGLPVLAFHVLSIALTKALQSHSRSLLEDRCERRGHPERAQEVEHSAHKTGRAAETLAVLTGLLLAALIGVGVRFATFPSRVGLVILPVLVIGLLGYVVAGVIGKVFAEVIIDSSWLLAAAAALSRRR